MGDQMMRCAKSRVGVAKHWGSRHDFGYADCERYSEGFSGSSVGVPAEGLPKKPLAHQNISSIQKTMSGAQEDDTQADTHCAANCLQGWVHKLKNSDQSRHWGIEHDTRRLGKLGKLNKRYLVLDFTQRLVYYSNMASKKRISHPVAFHEIHGVNEIDDSMIYCGKPFGIEVSFSDRKWMLFLSQENSWKVWLNALFIASGMRYEAFEGKIEALPTWQKAVSTKFQRFTQSPKLATVKSWFTGSSRQPNDFSRTKNQFEETENDSEHLLLREIDSQSLEERVVLGTNSGVAEVVEPESVDGPATESNASYSIDTCEVNVDPVIVGLTPGGSPLDSPTFQGEETHQLFPRHPEMQPRDSLSVCSQPVSTSRGGIASSVLKSTRQRAASDKASSVQLSGSPNETPEENSIQHISTPFALLPTNAEAMSPKSLPGNDITVDLAEIDARAQTSRTYGVS